MTARIDWQTRGIDHWNLGTQSPAGVGNIMTVAGTSQLDVGEERIDPVSIAQNRDGLLRGISLNHGKSVVQKLLHDNGAHEVVVFDDKNGSLA